MNIKELIDLLESLIAVIDGTISEISDQDIIKDLEEINTLLVLKKNKYEARLK